MRCSAENTANLEGHSAAKWTKQLKLVMNETCKKLTQNTLARCLVP